MYRVVLLMLRHKGVCSMVFQNTSVGTHAELENALSGVEGWLSLEDAVFLCESTIRASGPVVEIGAFRGRSTIALALGARTSGSLVYSIDPHAEFVGVFGGHFVPADREAYYRNLIKSGLAMYAALVNLPSVQVAVCWQKEIGLLFVDGDHRYEAVRQDLLSWAPFIRKGGLIVFDDAMKPGSGPCRVFDEAVDSGSYTEVPAAGKLRAMAKK